jgi:hypothetical protein
LTRQQAAVDEVWSQEFIHDGHVALTPDLLEELADQGLVFFHRRHSGFLLRADSRFPNAPPPLA